ncbi:MAG: HIT family protein [Candidatus ainarchaeum sp.]|nr:HIT family protein [Candidatus ainarchaeum sp.]
MKECVFCKIIKGEIPCEKIFENEKYLAFLDINPMYKGHTLLIPKKHTDYIFDIKDNELTDYFLMAKKISFLLKKVLKTEKVGLVVEGFFVRHAHIHLIPINIGDSLDPHLQKPIKKEELEEIGKQIRKNIKKIRISII